MAKFRAIVSIQFDTDDLRDIAKHYGSDRIDAFEAINGEMDNLSFGCAHVEQLFQEGEPTIHRLSGGMNVEINEHED